MQQFLRFFAAGEVVEFQQGVALDLLKGPQQIGLVNKQFLCHAFQRKLLSVILLHHAFSGIRQFDAGAGPAFLIRSAFAAGCIPFIQRILKRIEDDDPLRAHRIFMAGRAADLFASLQGVVELPVIRLIVILDRQPLFFGHGICLSVIDGLADANPCAKIKVSAN